MREPSNNNNKIFSLDINEPLVETILIHRTSNERANNNISTDINERAIQQHQDIYRSLVDNSHSQDFNERAIQQQQDIYISPLVDNSHSQDINERAIQQQQDIYRSSLVDNSHSQDINERAIQQQQDIYRSPLVDNSYSGTSMREPSNNNKISIDHH
ncbi:unnamed protein product [Mytilus edulis]|uniref:Uncharacterized protein n=1 Tax=Mytilus edulis TaxID=6550 RepID=A0A8S3UML8_MYTED|nr:unnamed protein product [Mytilus edulis]